MAGAAAVGAALPAALADVGAGAEVEGATGVLSVTTSRAFALACALVLAFAGRFVGRCVCEGGSGVGLATRRTGAATVGRDDSSGGAEGSDRRDPVRESI